MTETKIFKLEAFQPTEEELEKFVADSRKARKKPKKKAVKYESSDDEDGLGNGHRNKTFEEKGMDDSDDDFPDLVDILRPTKKQKIQEAPKEDVSTCTWV